MNDAIQRTLIDIAGFLREHEVRFVLIGGIAVSVRGEPRCTADVDLVLGIDLDRALELVEATEDSRFRPLFPDVSEVVRTSYILPCDTVRLG